MNWLTSSAFRVASVSCLSTAFLFTATSCEDPNDLGVELPGTSPINTEYRDYRVNAATILQDSVETLNADRALAGRYTDLDLGTTTAQAYFNLRASTDTLASQVTDPKLDSVVLISSFDEVYGSSARPVSFDVYSLAASLDDKKTYNAGTMNVALGPQLGEKLLSSLTRTTKVQVAVNPGVLKSKNKKLNGVALDSTITTTPLDPTVRLVLHKDRVRNSPFAVSLFEALKDASFNQVKLDALCKGVAVVPSSEQKDAIVGFNRASINSIAVYYRGTKTDGTPLKVRYRVRLGTSYQNNDPNTPRYFTQISMDFKAPFAALAVGTPAVRTADSLTYIQEGTGLATKLSIPGLKELQNQTALAINRAELIIPVKSPTTVAFKNPVTAFLYELNANNRVLQRTVNVSPVERIVQANLENPLGQGKEATVTLNEVGGKKYYSVVITTYLQAYLATQIGEQPAALMLSPVLRRFFGLSLNRSTIDAQNIKLRVYSSKLR